MRFTHDSKSSLEFLAQSQKGNEVGFKHVGAKLRQIEGGVEQLASKTEQIESAWEAWTEEDGLDPCAEGDDDDDWLGWGGGDPDQNDGGAPDGAADGKEPKRTRINGEQETEEQGEEEDEEGQGDDALGDFSEYEIDEDSDGPGMPGLESGSEDEFTVPGCTDEDKDKKKKTDKVKVLKSSNQRVQQRSRSQPAQAVSVRTRCKEAETITLHQVPNAPGFKAWWNNLCQIISASSSHPERAFTWVRKVKKDSDFDLLNGSEGSQSLDIKFAVALKTIFPTALRNRVTLIEEKWIDRHETHKGKAIVDHSSQMVPGE